MPLVIVWTGILASEYAHFFYGQSKLSDFPEHPKLYILSTCLNTGNLWHFTKGEAGDYEMGICPANEFPVNKAVAASSAVPGIMPPLVITKSEYPGELPENQSWVGLVDGGVWDNLGISPMFREANKLDYIICSIATGSKKSGGSQKPPKRAFSVLLRSYGMISSRAQNSFIRDLIHMKQLGKFKGACFCKLGLELYYMKDSINPSEIPENILSLASTIRTDLDYFSDEKINVLMDQGYTALDAKLNRDLHELWSHSPQPFRPIINYKESNVRQLCGALKYSHIRLIRPWRF